MIIEICPRNGTTEVFDGWFEQLGRFGRAAHLAIPRLHDYRKHPDPWIPLWAQEALERITSPPPQYHPAR